MKDHLHVASGKILQRGLIPTPRHILCGAEPFKARAGAIPDHFFIFPKKLSMWLNDTYGDCVTAEEAFNKACSGVFIEDATVLAWCRANGTLNGADLQPVIQQMQSRGFSQDSNIYGDGAPQTVNYGDVPTLEAAIYQAGMQGGCIKLGIAADELPPGAGNNNGWFMLSANNDSNEDHSVSYCGYGTAQQFCDAINAAFGLSITVPAGLSPTTRGKALYTWSTIGFVPDSCTPKFVGESWIRNPSSVNSGTGKPDPDLVYITTGPTPNPNPTPTPTPIPGTITLPAQLLLNIDGTYTTTPSGIVVDPTRLLVWMNEGLVLFGYQPIQQAHLTALHDAMAPHLIKAINIMKLIQVGMLIFGWVSAGMNPALLPALIQQIVAILTGP